LGSYYDKAQRDSIYPLIIEQKGLKIALLNCTYGTNGLPVTHPNIVNLIDTAQIKEDIKKAGESGADLEIMAIHWGEEYELRANETQRDPATFLVNQGIDAIIGAHPHVVQNFETLLSENREIPVYYSLGNSISNQREPHTNGGIMVKLLINVNTKQIIDHSYLPVYVYKGKLNGVYQYHLIPTTDFIRRMPRFELNKTDSAGLMYFHEQTVKRLANSKLMADVDNKPIPLPKVRMSKIATPLDRFRQQYHLKF
jgi:poly-gamma-glutamate synthesis protein (capsule biosynthesis protein)